MSAILRRFQFLRYVWSVTALLYGGLMSPWPFDPGAFKVAVWLLSVGAWMGAILLVERIARARGWAVE